MNQFFILQPFNAIYFIFEVAIIIPMVLFINMLNKKDIEERRKIMIIFTTITAISIIIYKFSFKLDPEFINDYSKYWREYTILNELPFNPCNVILLLFPLGLYKKNDWILSFCVFLGLTGTLLAIIFPKKGYVGYSIFTWHMFGSYLLHTVAVAISVGLIVLDLYKPKYHDIFKAIVVMTIAAFSAYIFSLFLRKTGLNPTANYFFMINTEENIVFDYFYKFFPVPGLYLITVIPVFIILFFLIVSICKILKQNK